MSRTAAHRKVRRFGPEGWTTVDRAIPEEAPVTMVPNGAPFAAVMATPADLEDLCLGFAVTERMVDHADDVAAIEVTPVDEGFEARFDIPAASAAALAERRRAFAARTSCSLCGLEDLDRLLAKPAKAVAGPTGLTPAAILAAMAEMPRAQRLNAETKSAHAAGWIGPDGALAHLREDVGRHNALDKLIGALLRQGLDPSTGAICLTSRCSIEMVLKAAAVGVGVIAAASSPTELAVRAAEATGVTLAAGARDRAFDVYACPERLERQA